MLVARRQTVVLTILILLLAFIGAPIQAAPTLSLPNQRLESTTPDYSLQAIVNGAEVVLSWSDLPVPSGKQLRGYHVYRSETQGDLFDQSNQITEFATTKPSFKDYSPAGLYYYAVQAIYSDGTKALASRPQEVNTGAAAPGGVAMPISNALSTPRANPPIPSLPGSEVRVIDPKVLNALLAPPIPVAFNAVPNRYTGVDPATQFDLNGDLVGDIKVSSNTVTAMNGTQVQLIDPAALNLDQVQIVPAAGYGDSVPLQLARVYVAKLSGGGYGKFVLLQTSPKVTISFHYGVPTTSVLTVDGQGGHAVLTWDALSDATLGYNVYRYEFLDNNAYSVTLLNDFTVQGTTFTDNTAANRYYLYVVISIKSNGAFGPSTTVAAVQVQSVQRVLQIGLAGGATLDGQSIQLTAAPVIKNGRLMVPASLLSYAGVKVTFEPGSGKLTLARRLDNVTYTVVMTIDVPDYTWNGSSYKADVPPYSSGGDVMIPIRVAAPALGYGLSFNSTDRTAAVQWYE